MLDDQMLIQENFGYLFDDKSTEIAGKKDDRAGILLNAVNNENGSSLVGAREDLKSTNPFSRS